MHIVGFTLALMTMVFVAVGLSWPRFFNPFIPEKSEYPPSPRTHSAFLFLLSLTILSPFRTERGEGHIPFKPDTSVAVIDVSVGRILEAGDLERRTASLSGAAGGGLKGDEEYQRKHVHGEERGPSDSDEGTTLEKRAGRGGREVY